LQIYDDIDTDVPVPVNERKLPSELDVCIREVNWKLLYDTIHIFQTYAIFHLYNFTVNIVVMSFVSVSVEALTTVIIVVI